jgi:predicted PhzF superfamily epimerase YddE/YHI9
MQKTFAQIRQTAARVFCQTGQGGNPVTIFASPIELAKTTQIQLAKSCSWESVVVDTTKSKLAFFLPTGEQVSFCAHAAMGGITELVSTTEQDGERDGPKRIQFSTVPLKDTEDTTSTMTSIATIHENNMISLQLDHQPWTVSEVPNIPALRRLLREVCGLESSALTQQPIEGDFIPMSFPTFFNASVARPKTLIYVNSLEALHGARAPRDALHFARVCDTLNTTGLYLYTQDRSNTSLSSSQFSYACRQFPRASAYPEDPATGIAAAALGAALHRITSTGQHYQNDGETFLFTQGTAMGRPSTIHVENVEFQETNSDGVLLGQKVSYWLRGQVQIDDQQYMEVEMES